MMKLVILFVNVVMNMELLQNVQEEQGGLTLWWLINHVEYQV